VKDRHAAHCKSASQHCSADIAREDRVVADNDSRRGLREVVTQFGIARLVVDDLTSDDLDLIGWSGSPLHVRHVAAELQRAADGEAEYLAVRAPDGAPVAKGAIDYTLEPGVGVIHQLATHPDVRGLGIGARVIEAAEVRIRARGLTIALLSVEPDNPRAQALYERLGYVASGERTATWERQRDDGSTYLHATVLTDLSKSL
jgi:ribosomal protein S18 acetylase RimI-like enzyme